MGGIGNPTRPRRTRTVPVGAGKTRRYSTLDDYVQFYIEHEYVIDRDDLIKNRGHLISEIFFDWVRTGQLACLFAAFMARTQKQHAWDAHVIRGADTDPNIGNRLTDRLDGYFQNSAAVQFIFPDLQTTEQIASFLRSLCEHDRWYRTHEHAISDDGQICGVNLRWILPTDKHVNMVLGFADIDGMPMSRRSPFPAIMVRASDVANAKDDLRELENGRLRVHLADVEPLPEIRDQFRLLLDHTKKERLKIVEPELLDLAKAKVSFALPCELAGTIPCIEVEVSEKLSLSEAEARL